MKKLLERISWLTRRWNFSFHLFDLYLHDHNETWGFNLFEIRANFKNYSLLRLECRFPNKTTVRRFVIDSWDILFISQFLWKHYQDLDDRQMWSRNLSAWEKIKLIVLQKIM